MYDTPQFEIPAAVRDLAEKNVNQVRQAYDQFMTLASKAQETIVKSQGTMAGAAVDVQAKMLQCAQTNIDANFRFAADLARARDLKEYLEIQSNYARAALETYSKQAQDITRLMTDAAHAAQPKR
ncbi:MAG: phasin family protein [Hyphomicrobium sp.]